ncbi:DUF2066 domain-containing protein [Oceanicaulis sp. UBA2681]|mgnify:CR=1 FL=1|uniref:DUF2066 domain-containing protein n=1 Tax=Oceanicaulis sp. UBA2681 TaxID=1947007 RepID=UPI002353AEC7|nr:DUF2066 domain-containing protein [Oceanicaulis sp. UBA2681]
MQAIRQAVQWAFAGLAAGVMTASALADGPFTIDGVAIDARADTAYDAQRTAMEEGQTQGALRLIERLTLPEDRMQSDLMLISAEDAASLIAGLQISDEQRSATRYRGVLSLDFDPRAVRRYLSGLGVPFVESQSAPIAVIPVTELGSGERVLGGDWLDAWREGGFQHALTPMLAVEDDAISASAVVSLNVSALRSVLDEMGLERAMVLVARQEPGSVRAGGVIVSFDGEGGLQRETVAPISLSGGFEDAARAIVERREQDWKRASVVRDTTVAELDLSILFDNLAEWRELQQAVTGASLIQNARLDAVSRTGAAMTITHRGAREQVMAELSARGAVLAEDEALGWTVRSR